jgi:DNA-binding NarL/FixJ family response regulator
MPRLTGLHRQETRAESRDGEAPAVANRLTRREREVLALVAVGRRDRAIAAELGISQSTVVTHITSILNKLCADNRTAATAMAIRRGLF